MIAPAMLAKVLKDEPQPMAWPEERGLHAAYRSGEVNHCPGCGRTHWYIGRISAECAFCTTALPLNDPYPSQAPKVVGWSSHPKGYSDLG